MRSSAVLVVAVLLAAGSPLDAQPAPPVCSARAVPVTVRAEGLSELVGEIVISCTGGSVSPAGQPVPLARLSLTLNTSLGNAVVPGGSQSDAALIVDNPAPGNQVLQDGQQTPNLTGVGDGLDYNNPDAAANMGQRVPNVFQGTARGRNALFWIGVPIDPPGTVGTRILRIANVRARVADSTGAVVRATLTSPELNLAAVSVDVATIQPGLLYAQPDRTLYTGIAGAAAYPVGTAVNPDLPSFPANPSPSFQILFAEGFPNAFKTRTAAQGTDSNPFPDPREQAALGENNFAETGYFNPRIGFGLSNYGTRLGVLFSGVPANVRLFVRSTTGMGTSSTLHGVGIRDCIGPAAPAPAINGLYEVALTNGSGVFCAEIARHSESSAETAVFDGFLSIPGGAVSPGTIFSDLSLVPTSFYPPGFGSSNSILPVFHRPADPVRQWQSMQVAGRLFGQGDPAANQIQISRAPAFQNGIFVETGTNTILSTNVIVINSLAPRPATITPVLRSGPAAQREATVGWISATQSQANTPLTLNIQANPAGLAPGTYTAGVRISTPPPNETVNEIPIQLVVPEPGPRSSAPAVVGAADYAPAVVAAGQAAVVFGAGFGPAQLAGLQLSDGRVATSLAETRVLFDGQPAPLIYAISGQVSALVPFGVAGRTFTEMRVEYRGVRSPPVFLRVLPSMPGLFTADSSGFGQGAILNQNNSFNSAANPASPGDVVVLYGSGAGQTNPAGVDGQVAALPLPVFTQPVRVFIDGQEAELLYAGPAPGLVEGIFQVNARVPPNTRRAAEVHVIIGGFRSQPGVTLAVRP